MSDTDKLATKSDEVLTAGTGTTTRKFEKDKHAQRNDTTRRIEAETLQILKWENPIRSGAIFSMLLGSIVLTSSYSLLQIISSGLTIAILLNLIYVCGTGFFQTVVADHSSVNPYRSILENDQEDLLNKENAARYSSTMVDIAETVLRALTRIVLIEERGKSAKWLCIFFIMWRISAYVSSRVIISAFIVSAFIVPRLYISNKDIIDARIQQGQTIINTQLHHAQEFANAKISNVKSQIDSKKPSTTAKTD